MFTVKMTDCLVLEESALILCTFLARLNLLLLDNRVASSLNLGFAALAGSKVEVKLALNR